MSLQRDVRFAGQIIFPVAAAPFNNLPAIDNLIFKSEIPALQWLYESTLKIGEWRDILRSCYMRWALAVNGLYSAAEKYEDFAWKSKKEFTISGLRTKGMATRQVTLVTWNGDQATTPEILLLEKRISL